MRKDLISQPGEGRNLAAVERGEEKHVEHEEILARSGTRRGSMGKKEIEKT